VALCVCAVGYADGSVALVGAASSGRPTRAGMIALEHASAAGIAQLAWWPHDANASVIGGGSGGLWIAGGHSHGVESAGVRRVPAFAAHASGGSGDSSSGTGTHARERENAYRTRKGRLLC
jgi:hypothetical protein